MPLLGSIEACVRYDGAYVGNATVSATDHEGRISVAKGNGCYYFDSLPSGDYSVKAEYEGASDLMAVTVDEGAWIHLDFWLISTSVVEGELAQVIRVIDGDTIEVELGNFIYKVRYIGMNSPEMDEYCGPEAKAVNTSLVEGQTIRLVKDVSETDRYGRLLRYVYVGDIFVNAELVRLGYASAATYPSDVEYSDLFVPLEREAREAERGCWATPEPTVAPPTPTAPPAGASDVQIECIFYDGHVSRVESDEYVQITNFGAQAQDLAGWRLVDISEGYPSLVFPSYILGPGESIRVYTNEYHPEWGGFSFRYGKAVWNNDEPDMGTLYGAQGQEVSRKSYPPGCH